MIVHQIRSLRLRLRLVRYMQTLGIFSFLCCVVCMYSIYNEWTVVSRYVFAASLLSLLTSLVISLIEITQSTKALEMELSDIEEFRDQGIFSNLWPGTGEKK